MVTYVDITTPIEDRAWLVYYKDVPSCMAAGAFLGRPHPAQCRADSFLRDRSTPSCVHRNEVLRVLVDTLHQHADG